MGTLKACDPHTEENVQLREGLRNFNSGAVRSREDWFIPGAPEGEPGSAGAHSREVQKTYLLELGKM